MSGATTIAEGDVKYKTDASLIIGGRNERSCVLRTTLDTMDIWKSKYVKTPRSPFEAKIKTVTKEAAIIDGEVWVFNINATLPPDLVAAVEIACRFYKVKPDDIFENIYVKNLNAEREHEMAAKALIQANKNLYTKTCEALLTAARSLNIRKSLNFYVFSNKANFKIPHGDLRDALTKGGAISVTTDDKKHEYTSGSNDGKRILKMFTHLHLATLQP